MMKGMGGGLVAGIIGTIILIILSIIYFVITLFVVKAAADIVFAEAISVDWAVLAAAIITLGSMFGGAMGARRV
jgi:hypothetical protein